MAVSRNIRIMISSRCNDKFPPDGKNARTLTEIRKELKREIEAQQLFGLGAFEVWINEETPPQGGNWDSWDVCLKVVRDCDILLVLYNGNAGWAGAAGDIGICHDELSTAYSTSPGKIRLIDLGAIPLDDTDAGKRNKRFQAYYQTQTPFRGAPVTNLDELKERVNEALRDAVVRLTQSGVIEANRGGSSGGPALNWSRLNFITRQRAITDVLKSAVAERTNATEEDGNLLVKIGRSETLFVPNSVPAAMSVAAAREMVGQPFLRDHLFDEALETKRGGPVHLIGCHKGITEAQAMKLLGFPDATVVTTTFGVYVADDVQKIQLVLIRDCRDESNTRHGVQRFFEWLEQTGEGTLLAKRAAARARIVRLIAKELSE